MAKNKTAAVAEAAAKPPFAEGDLVQEKDGTVSVVETVAERTATVQPLFRMDGDVPRKLSGIATCREVAHAALTSFSY